MLWRIHKDTGIVSDSQLISVDQLEDHVADLPEEDLKQLEIDTHKFLEYWSYGSKQHSANYISHIFGIVRINISLCIIIHLCFMSYICKLQIEPLNCTGKDIYSLPTLPHFFVPYRSVSVDQV